MAEPRRAVALVDTGAIERNCRRLARELSGGTELCAVVKADGYGHGAVESARAALAGGASTLAVAAAAEAAELRAAFPDARILTMGALSPPEFEQALAAGSEVAAWRPAHLRACAEAGERLGTTARVHVKHDSGMGRLGNPDAAQVLELLDEAAADERLEPVAIWTHFATADELDGDGSAYFAAQVERFADLVERVRERHPGLRAHAANSAATLREPASHFDMVRCGVAVYGLDPFQGDPADRELEPALELRSYVADVKPFAAGASAGYGRRWSAERETLVGVLPIGYGDGVRRGLTNNADVLVGGRRVPLVGTVSMDNVTVDLGPPPAGPAGADAERAIAPGEPAVLIGRQGGELILAEEVARRLGTINYEVTCGISPRVPREHR